VTDQLIFTELGEVIETSKKTRPVHFAVVSYRKQSEYLDLLPDLDWNPGLLLCFFCIKD